MKKKIPSKLDTAMTMMRQTAGRSLGSMTGGGVHRTCKNDPKKDRKNWKNEGRSNSSLYDFYGGKILSCLN
jgi:hypothetical protein